MKLGKVKIDIEYVVDLDNEDMIEQAKNALYEDLMNAYKYNIVNEYIHVTDEDKTLKKENIPLFLTEEAFIDDIS